MKGVLFILGFLAVILGFALLVVAVDNASSCAAGTCGVNAISLPLGASLVLVGLVLMSTAYLMATTQRPD